MSETRDPSQESLSQLLARWREEESAAMEIIYREMFPGLCGVARRTLGTIPGAKMDSEDVVQSALGSLCRFMRNQSGPIEKTRNDIWQLLFRIVTRKATRRRTRQTLGLGGGKLGVATDLENPDGPLRWEDFLQTISTHELDLIVSEILEKLEPLEARIVILAMEGHTREEIGQQLGYSDRSIQRKLEIIRTRLDRYLN